MTATSTIKTTIDPTIPASKPSTTPALPSGSSDAERTDEIGLERPHPRHSPATSPPDDDDDPSMGMEIDNDDIHQEPNEMDTSFLDPPIATERPLQKKIDAYFSPKPQAPSGANTAISASQTTTGDQFGTRFPTSNDNTKPQTSPGGTNMDVEMANFESRAPSLTPEHTTGHNDGSTQNDKNDNSDMPLDQATITTNTSEKIHTTSTPTKENNASSRDLSELHSLKEKLCDKLPKNNNPETTENTTTAANTTFLTTNAANVLAVNPQGPNSKTQDISASNQDSGRSNLDEAAPPRPDSNTNDNANLQPDTIQFASNDNPNQPSLVPIGASQTEMTNNKDNPAHSEHPTTTTTTTDMEIDDASPAASPTDPPTTMQEADATPTTTDGSQTTNGHAQVPPIATTPQPPTQSQLRNQDWTPIRLSWRTTGLTENDGIHNPYVTDLTPADSNSTHPHFTQIVLKKVIARARNSDSHIQFKSSKNETILTPTKLDTNWSTNEFKRMFSYSMSRRQLINVTLWVKLAFHRTFSQLKRSLLPFLKTQEFYLNAHFGSIHHADVYVAGWYSQNHHPDVCDFKHFEYILNRQLKSYFDGHRQEILDELQHHQAFIRDWNPDTDFPRITIEIHRPRWQESKNRTWTTRAVGVTGAKRYKPLLQLLLAQIDLASNDGKATFVDSAMQHAGREMNNEYGKALSQHQSYLAAHSYQIIHGITESTMDAIYKEITALPGIISVHATTTTVSYGTWRILTTRAIDQSSLVKLDTILTHSPRPANKPFDIIPYRLRKAAEQVHPALRSAWRTQNQSYIAPKPTPRMNAWTKGPPNIIRANHHTVEKPKVTWHDEQSITTKATTSSDREQIDNLAKTIAEMTAEMKKAQSAQDMIIKELRGEIADLKQDQFKNQEMRKHYKQSHLHQVKTMEGLTDGMATLQASFTHHDKILTQTDAYLTDLRRDHNDLRKQVTTYEDNRKQDNAAMMDLIRNVLSAVQPTPTITQDVSTVHHHRPSSSQTMSPSSPKKIDTTKRSRDTSTPDAPETRSPQHKMIRGSNRHVSSQEDPTVNPRQLEFNPSVTKPPDTNPIPDEVMTTDLDDDDPNSGL